MSEDRFEDLLGPYLLDQLTAEEERELEQHLELCSGCRDELEQIRQAHTLLREVSLNEPPAGLKSRTMTQATGRSTVGFGVGWKLWAPAAAALLLAAILGVVFLRGTIGNSPAELPLTATALAPGARGELRGERVGENFQFELDAHGLPKLRKDEYYEMWYARKDGKRISCGTFRPQPGGRTAVKLTAPVNAASYPKIEVTREPDDGNPGTSGKKVLVGDLRSS
jgi:anti-sigma-K factor RskA